MADRQLFDVDSYEKDEFKVAASGKARWDPEAKRWYMSNDDVRRAPNKQDLAKWRPPHVYWAPEDADMSVTIYGTPHQCLKCKLSSVAVTGFAINDPQFEGQVYSAAGGRPLKFLADALCQISTEKIEHRTELAHLRRRWSQTRQEIYFANCCRDTICEFLFGEFFLHQALAQQCAADNLAIIAKVPVPRRLLEIVIHNIDNAG